MRAVLAQAPSGDANLMALHSARDCYEILGVGRDVGPDALRTAYRKACLRTHPDKPGGCAARFRAVVAAYDGICVGNFDLSCDLMELVWYMPT